MARGHDYDEGLAAGGIAAMGKTLDDYWRGKDPKETKANLANSSVVRRERNLLRRLPDYLLARELLRRAMIEKKQEDARERQERFKARQLRKKASAVASA